LVNPVPGKQARKRRRKRRRRRRRRRASQLGCSTQLSSLSLLAAAASL
jgi:hypothetical protein